jgi:TRAP transporter TAXI family solute receptor
VRLRWRSGPVGASWIAIDTALARIVEETGTGIEIEVVPGGGRENIDTLRLGECDIATSIEFLALAAYSGLAPYETTPFRRLRTLALGWNQIPFHLIRASDAPDREFIGALRSPGARIGIPPESTSDELTFRHVLSVTGNSYASLRSAGVTIEYADYDTLADLFASGGIDWIFGATAAPARVVEKIGQARDGELLPIVGSIANELAAIGYRRTVLEQGTYPDLQRDDIDTIAMTSTIVTTDRLPSDIAREIIARLTRDPDRVRRIHPSLQHAATTPPLFDDGVPRHPALG